MKNSWWSFAKDILENYEDIKRELARIDAGGTPVIPVVKEYKGARCDKLVTQHGEQRSVHVSTHLRKCAEAVERMWRAMGETPDGKQRLRLLTIIYKQKSHSLIGAAMQIPVSERTAKRWNAQALYMVAVNMGWLWTRKRS